MPKPLYDISSRDGEKWKPIPGFENWYEVSNLGRVKSLRTSNGQPARILRQNVKHLGYRSVCLYRGNSHQNRRMVHRLVLSAFVGECPDGYVACHRNGDASDNRLQNLYWGSVSENQLDAVRHGTHRHAKKTHCPSGHPYDEENTRHYRGGRYCRACQRCRSKKPKVKAA